MRRAGRVLATVVLALALVGCEWAGVRGPKVALFGDSVADDADVRLERQVSRDHRYIGWTMRTSVTADHLVAVDYLLKKDPPSRLIIALGVGDARDRHGDRRMRKDIRALLDRIDRTKKVTCVRWLDLKVHGVNGFYEGVVARSDDFNRILRQEVAKHPKAEVVDYDQWARRNPQAFLADGLHLDHDGRVAYAKWIAEVAGDC